MMHHLGSVPQSAEVGGKAFELDHLIRAGLNVPPGVVFDLVSWDTHTWKTEIATFPDGLYAVRSSSPQEDGKKQSMAGVFLSKTRVPKKDLITAINEIQAQAKRVSGAMIPIIIQSWIEGTVSGIAFSKHPTKYFPGACIIDAAKGTAEQIVSGTKDPLRAYFWEDSELTPKKFPLQKQLAKELVHNIHQIEQLLNTAADIEWTTDGKKIFLLQARPMTRTAEVDKTEAEEARIMSEFGREQDLKLERGDYSETIPRPSAISFDLIKSLYIPGGPFARAAEDLGLIYDETASQAYFKRIFGYLYADARKEPIKTPNGLFKKIRLALQLQKQLTIFPETFYQSEPLTDLQSEQTIQKILFLYAKTALLARTAQTTTSGRIPGFLERIWNLRESWLQQRPDSISRQDFELGIESPVEKRKVWSMPKNIAELYAIIREDAKDELRPLLADLRLQCLEQNPEALKPQEDFQGIQLPLTLEWNDLFDLQNAFLKEIQDPQHLRGIGVSPGEIKGSVYIGSRPQALREAAILVVPALTPEWFQYLTPNVLGIVSETGSLLSHGAIQCRERNIPAIFGISGITHTLKAGEEISINGKTGRMSLSK